MSPERAVNSLAKSMSTVGRKQVIEDSRSIPLDCIPVCRTDEGSETDYGKSGEDHRVVSIPMFEDREWGENDTSEFALYTFSSPYQQAQKTHVRRGEKHRRRCRLSLALMVHGPSIARVLGLSEGRYSRSFGRRGLI